MKKNVAGQKVGAQLISATDGSAFTGSVTVYVTVDAGTQAAGSVGSGACTHEGNGYHTYAPAQAETNGDLVAFTFVGTGAIPQTVQVYTSFPQSADNDTRLVDIQSRLPAALTGGGNMKVDVLALSGDTTAADNAEAFFDGTGYAGTNNVIPTVTTVNGLASNVVNAAALATDAVAEISSAVWSETTRILTAGTNIVLAKGTGVTGFNDLDAAGVRGAVGLAAANLDTQLSTIDTVVDAILVDTAEIGTAGAGLTALASASLLTAVAGYLDTEIAAILADTNELQTDWANGGRLDLILDARASQTSVDTIDTVVDAIKLVTDAIPDAGALTTIQADLDDLQTRIPAALVSGRMAADMIAISGSTESADRLERTTLAIVTGTATSGGTVSSIPTSALSPAGVDADQFKGRIVIFDKDTTTAALRGQATDITGNTAGSTPTFTVTALTTAPVSGDTFTIT